MSDYQFYTIIAWLAAIAGVATKNIIASYLCFVVTLFYAFAGLMALLNK